MLDFLLTAKGLRDRYDVLYEECRKRNEDDQVSRERKRNELLLHIVLRMERLTCDASCAVLNKTLSKDEVCEILDLLRSVSFLLITSANASAFQDVIDLLFDVYNSHFKESLEEIFEELETVPHVNENKNKNNTKKIRNMENYLLGYETKEELREELEKKHVEKQTKKKANKRKKKPKMSRKSSLSNLESLRGRGKKQKKVAQKSKLVQRNVKIKKRRR